MLEHAPCHPFVMYAPAPRVRPARRPAPQVVATKLGWEVGVVWLIGVIVLPALPGYLASRSTERYMFFVKSTDYTTVPRPVREVAFLKKTRKVRHSRRA